MTTATVVAVHCSAKHAFSKPAQPAIRLLEGLGVEGDAHCGTTVQHLYDMRRDPTRPNLRQVHLFQCELLDEVNGQGHDVKPGDLGENISTRGLDILRLPTGTRLRIGAEAVIEVTGLRNPCHQIESFQKGLLAHMGEKAASGEYLRKAGVMSVVLVGGVVRAGDAIVVELPAGPHRALQPV
jgi:MOSC domain-containing protein YiiM